MTSETKVPNIRIAIPTRTTIHKYEPEYTVPLLEALWASKLVDGQSLGVHRLSVNNPCHTPVLFRETTARAEFDRLRSAYGFNPTNNEPIFDRIYPAFSAFVGAFDRAVARSQPTEEKIDENKRETLEVEELKGVGQELADALELRGFGTLARLAAAAPADVAAVPGISQSRAECLVREAGDLKYGNLTNDEVDDPDEFVDVSVTDDGGATVSVDALDDGDLEIPTYGAVD